MPSQVNAASAEETVPLQAIQMRSLEPVRAEGCLVVLQHYGAPDAGILLSQPQPRPHRASPDSSGMDAVRIHILADLSLF